jgi:hypothetical protein
MLSQIMAGAAAAPEAAAPAPPVPVADVLDLVPVVQPGDVILAEYFNALRQALALVAAAVDAAQLQRSFTLTFAPALHAALDAGAWRTTIGAALGPVTGTQAEGWMPLDLPNGVEITGVNVRGKLPTKPTSWAVDLTRLDVDATSVELYKTDLANVTASADTTFLAPLGEVGPAGAHVVNTAQYRYVLHTKLVSSATIQNFELRAVHVTCRRS